MLFVRVLILILALIGANAKHSIGVGCYTLFCITVFVKMTSIASQSSIETFPFVTVIIFFPDRRYSLLSTFARV